MEIEWRGVARDWSPEERLAAAWGGQGQKKAVAGCGSKGRQRKGSVGEVFRHAVKPSAHTSALGCRGKQRSRPAVLNEDS